MKKCVKCGNEKQQNEFSKNGANKDKLQSYCKECQKEHRRAWKKNNQDKVKEYVNKWKINNQDYFKNYLQDYLPKWREENKEYWKDYYKINCEKQKEYSRNWHKHNRGKSNARAMKYYTSKKNRSPKWLTTEHLRQIKIEYELATWCSKVMGEQYHVDHIVPLQGKNVSGLHVPWNLQVIPAKANISKGNRHE